MTYVERQTERGADVPLYLVGIPAKVAAAQQAPRQSGHRPFWVVAVGGRRGGGAGGDVLCLSLYLCSRLRLRGSIRLKEAPVVGEAVALVWLAVTQSTGRRSGEVGKHGNNASLLVVDSWSGLKLRGHFSTARREHLSLIVWRRRILTIARMARV